MPKAVESDLSSSVARNLKRRLHTTIAVALALAASVASASAAPTGSPFRPQPPTVRRPVGDVVSRRANVLMISWGQHPRRVIRVVSRVKVQLIARVLNTLPVEGNGVCAEGFLFGPPTITLAFRVGTRGRVVATASGLDSVRYQAAYCIPTKFSASGHKKLRLEGNGYLIKQAENILRRRLH